jgi:hypothetical protein
VINLFKLYGFEPHRGAVEPVLLVHYRTRRVAFVRSGADPGVVLLTIGRHIDPRYTDTARLLRHLLNKRATSLRTWTQAVQAAQSCRDS